jgi:hypothetical protein
MDLPADTSKCAGGRSSFFVRGDGTLQACHISGVPLGNLYDEASASLFGRSGAAQFENPSSLPEGTLCRARNCSCFLAYSLRNDIPALRRFGDGLHVRVPDRRRAIFLDVDGTLADAHGLIPPAHASLLRQLAPFFRIFLATALPYTVARRRCANVWALLDGGVFAEGADIRIFNEWHRHCIPLPNQALTMLPPERPGQHRKDCRIEGMLSKVTLLGIQPDETTLSALRSKGCRVIREGGVTGIVAESATKRNGALHICGILHIPEEDVVAAGNSDNDADLLAGFTCSLATPEASAAAQKAAKRIAPLTALLELCLPKVK